MFDVFLRAIKDQLFAPVARAVGHRIHPNMITLAAWLVGVMAAVAVARGDFTTALLLWIANRALDGCDGTLARVTGMQTDFGGYLDIVLDLSVYASVLLALILESHTWETAVAGAVLIGTFYVNGASWMYLAAILERRQQGATATGEQTTITMPAGFVAGAETFVFYVLFLLFPERLPLLFSLMSVGVVATIIQRIVWARRRLISG
ncbi:MAG: CDP-alcohol phosphatidyltransferase family protein [Gemmatimonadaceae bacterium]